MFNSFCFEKLTEKERILFDQFPSLFEISRWKLHRIIRSSRSNLQSFKQSMYYSELLRNGTWAYFEFLANTDYKNQCVDRLNSYGFSIKNSDGIQHIENAGLHVFICIVEYETDFRLHILTNALTVSNYLFTNRFEISPPWIFCPTARPTRECFDEYREVNYWACVYWEPFWNSMSFIEQYEYLKRYNVNDEWFNFLTNNQFAQKIRFYRTGDAYGEFSNFAAYPIELDGKVWPTVEHYFQAQKFTDTELIEQIRTDPNPMSAAKLGRGHHHSFKKNWDEIKDQAMQKALLAKFTQHHSLKELLLSTHGCEIIEHTKNDSYWADGGDSSGLNKLGCFLINLRLHFERE